MKKTEIVEMSSMVYIPNWNSRAFIDSNGVIRIELAYHLFDTREEFIKRIDENGYPNYLNGFFWNNKKKHRQDFMDARMELFDDVQKYYDELTKNQGSVK